MLDIKAEKNAVQQSLCYTDENKIENDDPDHELSPLIYELICIALSNESKRIF